MQLDFLAFSRTPSDVKRQRGFTLIATLLIVSLVTILIVSAMVAVQVEQSASYNTSEQEMARQNALFGLNQALNQLQISAGPDRRITARADILNSANTLTTSGSENGYTGTQSATDSGQCFWTGVWKNTFNDYSGCAGNGLVSNPDPFPGNPNVPGPGGSFFYYDYRPDGTPNLGTTLIPSRQTGSSTNPLTSPNLYSNKNVNWLISWPYSPTFTTPPDPTQSLSNQVGATGTVTIADNLNPHSTPANSSAVVVPKVPIKASLPTTGTVSTVGNFAYWVSDEGVKARVDIQNPYIASSKLQTSQASFQMAQSPAVNLALSLNSGIFPLFSSTPTDLRTQSLTAPTLASISYADPSGTWNNFSTAATYSSDFTTCSLGVIADSFNGGLRRDLTAAFEYPALYVRNFGDSATFDGLGKGASGYESLRKVYSVCALSQSSYGVSTTGVSVNGLSGTPYGGGGNGSDMILDGLRWDSLFYFYNTYHSTMPSPISAPAGTGPAGIGTAFGGETSGVIPGLTARFYQEVDPVNVKHLLIMDGILPVRLLWNYNILISLHPTGPNTSPPYTFDYIFGMAPNVVMYNPYNVAVTMPNKGGWAWFNDVGNSLGNTTITYTDPTTNKTDFTQKLSFSDESIQIGYDSLAYTPGELRCYGLSGDNQITTTETLARDRNWAYFTTNGDNNGYHSNKTLSSISTDTNACQYEEINASTGAVTLNNLNDKVTYSRNDLMLCATTYGSPCVYADNFPMWPGTAGTTGTSPGLGSYLLGSMPSVGTYKSFSSALGTATSLQSPIPTQTIVDFVDHVPGLNCANFIPWAAVVKNQTPTGLPFFSAGGALINPLNSDVNAYSRDYEGLETVVANSASDIQSLNILSNSNVTDTGWLPDSVGENTPAPRVIYDLPRQPLISIGQFKNMYCHYIDTSEYGNLPNGYYSLAFPVYPVGNSYQEGLPTNSPFALPTMIGRVGSQQQEALNVLNDANFLANETLFDGYFLSTIPPNLVAYAPNPQNKQDTANWPISASTFSQSYISSNQPLPNSRLVYYNRYQTASGNNKGNPPTPFCVSPNLADLQPSSPSFNLRKPAANLLLRGAFNVNSTSVAAWTALLCSTYADSSNNLFLFNYSSAPSATAYQHTFPKTDVPILHSLMSFGSVPWSGSAGNNVPWFGLTDLSTTMIQSLATQIVVQVKARGPFLSLGDFLNHRLTGVANTLSASGALQNAIDSLSINNSVANSSGVTPQTASTVNAANVLTPLTCSFPSTFTTAVLPTTPTCSGVGVPGTLLQSDLVQLLAPVIANRSDTFTVRAYGESLNPKTGAIEGKAWCEAVVQRLPEYVYSVENGAVSPNGNFAYDEPSQSINNNATNISGAFPVNGISPVNSAMGRRFKIISFRWLNQSEI